MISTNMVVPSRQSRCPIANSLLSSSTRRMTVAGGTGGAPNGSKNMSRVSPRKSVEFESSITTGGFPSACSAAFDSCAIMRDSE